jgi:hypothetical protein
MKLIALLAISLVSFSAMASSVEDKISSLEFNRNVKCEHVKNSFPFCYGTGAPFKTCRYTSTYSCSGAESFKAVLSVKTYFNSRTEKQETTVTKVVTK